MDTNDKGDFKGKYRLLKRKLKGLVFEHELLTEQLEQFQKKLLRVSRDRSFLLDRMLQYEHVNDSSSESDATDLSESDTEKPKRKAPTSPSEPQPPEKKKKYQKKEKKAPTKRSKEEKGDGKSKSLIEAPTASMPAEIFNTDREGDSDDETDHEAEPDKGLVIDVR